MNIRLALLAPLAFLAACGEEASDDRAEVETGDATGEVLGGTISDEMLPLEKLQSQSPPARRSATSDDGNSGGGNAPEPEVSTEPDNAEPETPEAEAAPAPPASEVESQGE